MLWCPVPLFCPLVVSERRKWINPLFPALRSGPTAASGACRQKQISSSSGFSHEANRRITSPAIPPIRLLTTRLFMISFHNHERNEAPYVSNFHIGCWPFGRKPSIICLRTSQPSIAQSCRPIAQVGNAIKGPRRGGPEGRQQNQVEDPQFALGTTKGLFPHSSRAFHSLRWRKRSRDIIGA